MADNKSNFHTKHERRKLQFVPLSLYISLLLLVRFLPPFHSINSNTQICVYFVSIPCTSARITLIRHSTVKMKFETWPTKMLMT